MDILPNMGSEVAGLDPQAHGNSGGSVSSGDFLSCDLGMGLHTKAVFILFF